MKNMLSSSYASKSCQTLSYQSYVTLLKDKNMIKLLIHLPK